MLALALIACSSTEVTGTVRDGLTGEPITGVEVTLAGAVNKAVTDGDGVYVIEDPAAGPQKLEFHKEGYVSPEPLALTLESGRAVEASPIALYPELDGPRAFLLRDGDQVALKDLQGAWKKWQVDVFNAYSGFPVEVLDEAPHLRPGAELYIYLGPSDGELDWYLHALAYVPEARIPARGFGMRSFLMEEHIEVREKTSTVVAAERLAPRWLRVEVPAATAPGRMALSPVPRSAGQVRFIEDALREGYAFHVDPPPAEIGDEDGEKVLKVEKGMYSSDTQQWEAARQVLLAWCEAPSNAVSCGPATEDLRLDEANMPKHCRGSMTVTGKNARFETTTCEGRGTRGTLKRDAETDPFRIASAVKSAAGDGEGYLGE